MLALSIEEIDYQCSHWRIDYLSGSLAEAPPAPAAESVVEGIDALLIVRGTERRYAQIAAGSNLGQAFRGELLIYVTRDSFRPQRIPGIYFDPGIGVIAAEIGSMIVIRLDTRREENRNAESPQGRQRHRRCLLSHDLALLIRESIENAIHV